MGLVHFIEFVKKNQPADKKMIDFFRGLEDHSDHTVNLSTFRKATKGSGLESIDRDALFEGLSREAVIRDGGPAKAGKILVREMAFLDVWSPEEEEKEDEAWESLAKRKMTSLGKGMTREGSEHFQVDE